MTVSRLFVGGLPPSVQPSELEARFVPFGQVAACEFAAPKHGNIIAYVDLKPKDDTSIAKCMSLYNHSRWKGHVLRVEVAHTHYLERLRQETEEAAARERQEQEEAAAAREAARGSAPSGKAIYVPMPGRKRKYAKTSLDGCLPDGKKRPKKTLFPPVQPLPLTKLTWATPKTASSALHKLNEIEHLPSRPYVPPASLVQRSAGVEVAHKYAAQLPKVPNTVPREKHGYLKALKAVDAQSQKLALRQQPQKQDAQGASAGDKAAATTPQTASKFKQSSSEAKSAPTRPEEVVEFLDEDIAAEAGGVDLDKFNSSSEDEGAQHQHQHMHTQATLQGSAQADSTDDEPMPGILDWDSDEVPDVDGARVAAASGNAETAGHAGRLLGSTEVAQEDEDGEAGTRTSDEDAASEVEDEREGHGQEVAPMETGIGVHGASPVQRQLVSAGTSKVQHWPVKPDGDVAPAARASFEPAVPSRPHGQRGMDLSRFGSDSEEEYRDVDESGDEHTRKLTGSRQQEQQSTGGGVAFQQPTLQAMSPWYADGEQAMDKAPRASPSQRHSNSRRRKQEECSRNPAADNPLAQDAVREAPTAAAVHAAKHAAPQRQLGNSAVGSVQRAGGGITGQEPGVQAQPRQTTAQAQGAEQQRVALQPAAARPGLPPPQEATLVGASTNGGLVTRYTKLAAAAPKPVVFTFSFIGGAAAAMQPRQETAVGSADQMPATQGRSGLGKLEAGMYAVTRHTGRQPAAVAPSYSLGMSFMRPADKSDKELKEAWEKQREALTADFKSKQRTAVRHAGIGMKKLKSTSSSRC